MSELLSPTGTEPDKPPRVPSRLSFFLVTALFLLAIGTALRVYHLGDRSLWYDEAVTANISRGTFSEVLEKTRRVSAPVVHPFILYLVEKVGRSAVAVRLPSALASLLAVFMMLAMVRAKVSQNAGLFAAAILAISASQIRYAQEVREYSLSVLFAAILIYCLLRWEGAGSRGRHPVSLYVALFFAPLVQYGLVFLAFAVLSTIVLRLWFSRDTCFRLIHVVFASAFLAAGGLLSFFLTLRYQLRLGTSPWYLQQYYFDPRAMSLLRFLGLNSKGLLNYFMPGRVVTACFVIAAVIFCVTQAWKRRLELITLLVITSVAITACASLARLYPFGGIRQCLFLAPGIILFAGVAFADLLQRFKGSWQPIVAVGFVAVILFSGYRGLLRQWPYGEYEDTLSILWELAKSSAPNDQVWVNHDAVDAFSFYMPQKDPRFIYGRFHADPKEYIADLFGSIDRHCNRIWLVFSHLQQPSDYVEEQLIVNSLRSGWYVQSVIAPTNTELFVAYRKTSP